MLSTGCPDAGEIAKQKANETKAMSLLKQWQVAQTLFLIEGFEGHYGSMAQLVEADLLDDETYRGWDTGPVRESIGGYLFSELRSDGSRAGLCAYPDEHDPGGRLIFLLLIHSPNPEDWAYYVAPFERIGGSVSSWPSSAELERYERLTPGTPQQGLDKARELLHID